MMTLTPPWQALACIVEHNTRDLIAGRFTLASEVASWFKTLAMLRESEGERLMENDPTRDDLDWHRALVATLIADGERLLLEWPANGPANADRISRADLAAAERVVQQLFQFSTQPRLVFWRGILEAILRFQNRLQLRAARHRRSGRRRRRRTQLQLVRIHAEYLKDNGLALLGGQFAVPQGLRRVEAAHGGSEIGV